jgi:hypothetical protein
MSTEVNRADIRFYPRNAAEFNREFLRALIFSDVESSEAMGTIG